jgi:hypothetical protein
LHPPRLSSAKDLVACAQPLASQWQPWPLFVLGSPRSAPEECPCRGWPRRGRNGDAAGNDGPGLPSASLRPHSSWPCCSCSAPCHFSCRQQQFAPAQWWPRRPRDAPGLVDIASQATLRHWACRASSWPQRGQFAWPNGDLGGGGMPLASSTSPRRSYSVIGLVGPCHGLTGRGTPLAMPLTSSLAMTAKIASYEMLGC